MEPEEIMLETEEAMEKAVEHLVHEFNSVRTGKASPALVEGLEVMVPSYGTTSRLKELAMITTPEPRLIMIQPFDPSTTQDIERAFKESRLGLNPAVDGKILRVPIPELSEERRKEMVKLARGMAEEARVRVRGARRDAMEAVKSGQKEGAITEDDQKLYEKDIQKLTDDHVKKVDEHLEKKEADIMTV